MNQRHDALGRISLLRQALDMPKRPVALFLGAGCPCSIKMGGDKALIPDIEGMTQQIVSDLDGSALKVPFAELRKHLKADLGLDPNLEEYLSHIRTLQEVPSGVLSKNFDLGTLEKLELQICESIVKLADVTLPDRKTPYHHLAAWIQGTPRGIPVELFTSNYDLLLEQALA